MFSKFHQRTLFKNIFRRFSVPATVLNNLESVGSYEQLNPVELSLKNINGVVFGWMGLFDVPVNHVAVISRYGKFDGYRTEGLRWTPPNGTIQKIFCGDINHTMKEMHVTDSLKNPIIVSAFVTYNIVHPVNKVFNVPSDDVLFNLFEQEVRTIVSSYSYDQLTTPTSKDEITMKIVDKINHNPKMELYGTQIQKAGFLEVNYAKQIAETMLVKQRATATIEARKEIVEATIELVNTITSRVEGKITKEDQSKLATFLITSLVSNQNLTPVININ